MRKTEEYVEGRPYIKIGLAFIAWLRFGSSRSKEDCLTDAEWWLQKLEKE